MQAAEFKGRRRSISGYKRVRAKLMCVAMCPSYFASMAVKILVFYLGKWKKFFGLGKVL